MEQDDFGGAYAVESAALVTDLLESTNDLVAAIDRNYRFLAFNGAFSKEFARIYGSPPRLRQALDDFLTHATGDPARAVALCARALGGESFSVEEEFVVGSRRKWFELRFSPIMGSDRTAIMAAVVIRDMTEHRTAERRFAALLEASPDAMLIMKPDGAIQQANSLAERMFGYQKGELTGRTVEDLVPERWRHVHAQQRSAYLQEPEMRPMGARKAELLGRRADGSEFPVEISLNPLRVGEETLVATAIRDVTERRAMLDELRRREREHSAALEATNRRLERNLSELEQSRAQLAAILNSLSEGVVIADLSGRILEMNAAALAMTGYTDPREARRHLSDFFETFELRSLDGTPLELTQWPLARVLRGESFTDVELEVRRNDGARPGVTAYSGALVRDTQGAPVLCLLTLRDISEHKRAEDALRDSANCLALALEAAGMGMFDFHPQTGLLTWDELAKRHFGLSADAPVDYDVFLSGLHPEDRARVQNILESALKPSGGGHYRTEYRTIGIEDGKRRWISAQGRVFFDSQGAAARMIGATLDITERKRIESALRKSEVELRTTFEHAAVGIVHLSLPERRFLRVNQAFCGITGYQPEELLTLTALDITHPDDRNIGADDYAKLTAGEIGSFILEKRYVRKDGSTIWARATISTVPEEAGPVRYGVSVIEDITTEKIAQHAHEDAERRLELAVAIAELGFWEWDVVRDSIYLSPVSKKLLGQLDQDIQNSPEEWRTRLHPEDRARVLDYLATFIRQSQAEYRLEYRIRQGDGSYRWIASRAVPETDSSGRVVKVIGTHLDVTDRKLSERRIREVALHDPLTGLPNRALIFEFGNHLLAAAERSRGRAGVLFIDLDRFKPINDLYGHEMGDRVLKEVAKRLAYCTRQEDLVGRLGGDEFLVILPHLDPDHTRASIVAEHVVNSIGRPFRIDTLELSLSPSIGISYYPEHGTDVDALIKAADHAMYQAKQTGRANFQFYSPELDQRTAAGAISLERRLRAAVQARALRLHYQPVIDIRSGRLLGAEALVRLAGDQDGDGGPQRFIPIAESAGLIGELGDWVATEACRQHGQWQGEGLPSITMAVNVSPLQFRQPTFTLRLQEIISDSGIDPTCLQVEVTETTLMENVEESLRTLEQLRSMGVKVALDDFGTGYSSLSNLSSLTLDKIKVDQSFVRRIERDQTSRAITKAIIALGRTLHLEVVGEGIESEATLQYLRGQGCDQAQGFLFSRPVPAEEFTGWYRQYLSNEAYPSS